jgi:vancomycin resistance protein YoaR
MKNFSLNNFQKIVWIASAALAVVLLAVFGFGQTAKAASPFDQRPVPTFSPVTSLGDITTVTVPANLVSQWRGLYTRPSGSLLRGSQINRGQDLKQYLLAAAIGKPVKPATTTYKYNPAAVYEWTKDIAANVNSEALEPELVIEKNRATKFTPPQTGKLLDRYRASLDIMDSLAQGKTTLNLKVFTTEPKTSLESLNDLGITELIGRGESKFNGSPRNRRHNIKVGVSKMAGIIVKPGEEFSFNKYLGAVEASTGFLPELVIKKEGTVPEFGGGLCQVSSTTFRAAMHAGLPITQRRNHSYAVQYYAPQGSDATIYPGVVDLKFTNDTGNSILIWPYLKDENYLIFDFYGTYDGRKVELGTPYSYDRKSDGSMKATWKRTVTRVGETAKSDVFNSVYQSPALFHKQEEFVPAASPNTPPPGITPTVGTPVTPTAENGTDPEGKNP